MSSHDDRNTEATIALIPPIRSDRAKLVTLYSSSVSFVEHDFEFQTNLIFVSLRTTSVSRAVYDTA